MSEIYNGYNNNLKEKARDLRRNMTPEERHLWYDFLRPYPVHFYRQRPIAKFYIADFFCPKAKLVIELDGSQHFTPEGRANDAVRTEIIEQLHVQVLRFTNAEIKQHFDGVCQKIDLTVQTALAQLRDEPLRPLSLFPERNEPLRPPSGHLP